MSNTYLLERITKTKELITAYEDALLAVASGAQMYKLDTGQSIVTVTKANLKEQSQVLDTLYNRLATLEARCYGAAVTVRPAW